MKYTLGALAVVSVLVLSLHIGKAQFPGSVTGIGSLASNPGTVPSSITGVALSNASFTTGSSGTVGTLSATLSSGSPTGAFSLKSSGTDHGGTTCNNYSSYLSVSGTNLNFNSSAPAQSYPGTCITYTQSGLSNSPYTQAFTLTGSSSSGVMCDIGPNYQGSIPEPAQAVGYTRCVANYDFTSTATFNNGTPGGSGYNFSNISSWLACNDTGASGPLWWNAHNNTPCSDLNMIMDSLNGKQTLDITFTPNDWLNGYSVTDINSTSGYNYPTPAGTLFPNTIYIEFIMRLPASTINSVQVDDSTNIPGGPWSYGLGSGSVMEWDFLEEYFGSASGGDYTDNGAVEHCGSNFTCEYGVGTNVSYLPGWGPSFAEAYHTYSEVAFQNSTTYGDCAYVDGSPVNGNGQNGCASQDFYSDGTASQAANSQNQMIIWDGAGHGGPGSCAAGACYEPSGNVDGYYQRITIFSCPSYASAPCTMSGNIPTSPP